MTCRTTITISSETKKKLAKVGRFGQSYDEVIKQLLPTDIDDNDYNS